MESITWRIGKRGAAHRFSLATGGHFYFKRAMFGVTRQGYTGWSKIMRYKWPPRLAGILLIWRREYAVQHSQRSLTCCFFSLLHFRQCLSSNLHFRQFNGSKTRIADKMDMRNLWVLIGLAASNCFQSRQRIASNHILLSLEPLICRCGNLMVPIAPGN